MRPEKSHDSGRDPTTLKHSPNRVGPIDQTGIFYRAWDCLFPYSRKHRFPGRHRGILGVIGRVVTPTTVYRWSSGLHTIPVDVCNSLIDRLRMEARMRLDLVQELEAYRSERVRSEAARPSRLSRMKGRG